jgi:ABC-type nitrate/sulfonate/bicarbonate transport system permease component
MVAALADLIEVMGAIGALLGAAATAWRRNASLETVALGAALGAVLGSYSALLYWLLAKLTG